MKEPSSASLKALLIAALLTNAILVAVVIATGQRLERSIQSSTAQTLAAVESATRVRSAALPAPGRPALPIPPTTPISPEQFQVQWEARYAAVAEAQCWQPHFAQYTKLPGHLDLQLDVSPDGGAEHFELLGYTNPGDAPDPGLAKAVFECVTILLRAANFPKTGASYSVRGRVNRPNPPPKFGAGAPSPVPAPSVRTPTLPPSAAAPR